MRRVLFAILLSICAINAHAAAVPAYTGGINNSVGSIVQYKIGKLGFAANDPRFGATVSAIGSAATTVAAGVATGAIASVGWPALLAAAGISAVVNGTVSLGMDGLIQWLWGNGNQAQLSGSAMLPSVPTTPNMASCNNGCVLSYLSPGEKRYFVNATNGVVSYFWLQFVPNATWSYTGMQDMSGNSISSTPSGGNYWKSVSVQTSGYAKADGSTVPAPSGGAYVLFFHYPPTGQTESPSYVPAMKPTAQGVAELPQDYVSQPLSDEMLAALVNALWANTAAVSATDAIPWDQSKAITAADVATWRAANPTLVPTVKDFIAPVAPPGTSAVPFTVPLQSPVTGTTTTTADDGTTSTSNIQIDFGQFQEPALDPPTIESILDPIFNLWPEWADFAFPPHSSSCPSPQFDLWGHTFTFDQMCQWIEMIRPAMQSAFAVVWAVLVIFIVMGA